MKFLKSTGVTRKIDELGRVVIPKEIRRNLGIRDGESLEIYTTEDSIVLKKYSEISKFEDIAKKMCELINNIFNVNVIITDREKVVASSIETIKINNQLEEMLIGLIDNRESFASKNKMALNFDDNTVNGYLTICPIIASSDSLGLIIVIDETYFDHTNITKFIAKLLADKINVF